MSLGVALAIGLAGVAIGLLLAPHIPSIATPEGRSRPPSGDRASGSVAPTEPSQARPPTASPAADSTAAFETPPLAPSRGAAAAAPERRRESDRRLVARADDKKRETGILDVTAPDGAEVYLDGRRIGTGSTHREIPTGNHRVEVRYNGAKVTERFHVAPRETWTYAVTPTVMPGTGAR